MSRAVKVAGGVPDQTGVGGAPVRCSPSKRVVRTFAQRKASVKNHACGLFVPLQHADSANAKRLLFLTAFRFKPVEIVINCASPPLPGVDGGNAHSIAHPQIRVI